MFFVRTSSFERERTLRLGVQILRWLRPQIVASYKFKTWRKKSFTDTYLCLTRYPGVTPLHAEQDAHSYLMVFGINFLHVVDCEEKVHILRPDGKHYIWVGWRSFSPVSRVKGSFDIVHFHPRQYTFIHFHPLSSTSIHFHPLSSTSIHFHSLSSTFIHFHPLSSIFIRFRQLSSVSPVSRIKSGFDIVVCETKVFVAHISHRGTNMKSW